ncbi:MAG: hypothetical protein ACO1PB_04625 [Ramlibacter sp.]
MAQASTTPPDFSGADVTSENFPSSAAGGHNRLFCFEQQWFRASAICRIEGLSFTINATLKVHLVDGHKIDIAISEQSCAEVLALMQAYGFSERETKSLAGLVQQRSLEKQKAAVATVQAAIDADKAERGGSAD